jgi:hypothetical protein
VDRGRHAGAHGPVLCPFGHGARQRLTHTVLHALPTACVCALFSRCRVCALCVLPLRPFCPFTLQVRVNGQVLGEVTAGSTCTFDRGGGDSISGGGDVIWLSNPSASAPADVLLLTGEPLREPIAMGGPIVMNTAAEIQQAYAELRAGTFL